MTSLDQAQEFGSDAETAASIPQPAKALERILAAKPELFVNLVGQPTIVLPASNPRPTPVGCPLRSERVKAWIAEFTWDQSGIVLAEREIDRIVMILIGKAWLDQRQDAAITDAMDQDPLLEALLILLHDQFVYDKTCTALLAELERVARSAGLETKDRLWPKGAPQLSRRIEALKPMLQRAGITAELGRRSGGFRFVKLTRNLQGGNPAPSPLTPSSDNSASLNEFRPAGGGDDDTRNKLFDLLRVPNQEGKP